MRAFNLHQLECLLCVKLLAVAISFSLTRYMMYISYIMQTSISLTRTQIYLTQQQQQRLADVSRQTAVSKSELIRLAVNQFLDQKATQPAKSNQQKLAGLAGLWTDRDDMADPGAYLQALRQPRF